jgi:Gly-Xaa carboxypeptidase
MPSKLRDAILDPEARETVVKYMDRSLDTRALVRTSTAVDVVSGGEKCASLT